MIDNHPMTRFFKTDFKAGYSNPLNSYREAYKYEIMSVGNNLSAFSDRRPRRDSKYASYKFVVWDLARNEQVYY